MYASDVPMYDIPCVRLPGVRVKAVVLNLFLPMDPFSLLFFLVDSFIAIGDKNNHLRLFLPLTDGWTLSD